ncbi:MAG: hypothetical protein P8P74_10460 [Crocinitomicaceae bacterium]|nr:hypothetical protein [Crocinitomicaceae bacterium]
MIRVLFLLSFSLLVLLASCNSDKRNKFVGGKLTVYYFDESEADVAKDVAFFWKENDLLSGNKQDLQVRKDDGRYTVSMIAASPKEVTEMPIDEVQLLAKLKKKLYVEVFNEKAFTLEICNDRFESIYTVE